MNVIGYVRVSTDGQVGEDKFGADVQREQITAYCEREGHTIMRWVEDLGESGAKERPGFDMLVYGDVENPPVESVVVAKSDRVARDIEIYYYYKMLLRKKGIGLISIAEDFGKFGVFADMLESFTLCVAKMERENINKRTSAGRGVKSLRGGYAGGRPPYGYRAFGKTLEIVPEEAEVVRKIFSMRKSGYVLREICEALLAEGVTTRYGKEWQVASIKSILDNYELYKGLYRYGGPDKPWVRGLHEAILPEDFRMEDEED